MKIAEISKSRRIIKVSNKAARNLAARKIVRVIGNAPTKVIKQMKIVAALRVKDEARWLREVLESIKWCSPIYLMNDHSKDETADIARECGAIILDSPFVGLDEARDKEFLVQKIANNHPRGTWVLMIDGDEILQLDGEAIIRQSIGANPGTWAFMLQIKYLWNSRDTIRVDGVYGRFRRPSLFQLLGQYSFRRSGRKGNLHPSCVPQVCRMLCYDCPAILWHFGYMAREDRIRKWRYYNELDPKNALEGYDPAHPERGSYCHIVQGDIPEVPIDVKLKHSGPLELKGIRII